MQMNSTYIHQKFNFLYYFNVKNISKIMILKYKNKIKISNNYNKYLNFMSFSNVANVNKITCLLLGSVMTFQIEF